MDYNEKVKYIIEDFQKSVIDVLGEARISNDWFMKFIDLQGFFLTKYKNNSMYYFVKKLVLAYGDVVDKEYRELIKASQESE